MSEISEIGPFTERPAMSEDRAIVSQELPPLPERAGWVIDMGWEDGWAVIDRHGVLSDGCDVYTADQMQAYARTAVEAAILKEREECAKLCQKLMEKDSPSNMVDGDDCAVAIRARK